MMMEEPRRYTLIWVSSTSATARELVCILILLHVIYCDCHRRYALFSFTSADHAVLVWSLLGEFVLASSGLPVSPSMFSCFWFVTTSPKYLCTLVWTFWLFLHFCTTHLLRKALVIVFKVQLNLVLIHYNIHRTKYLDLIFFICKDLFSYKFTCQDPGEYTFHLCVRISLHC